jgi:dihydroxyacetone kinase
MSGTIRRVVGGTSGPLYAVMLLRAAAVMEQTEHPTVTDWSDALTAAVEGAMALGGARLGDRTMIDALVPAARSLALGVTGRSTASGERGEPAGEGRTDDLRAILASVVEAAAIGTAQTAELTPRLGRSSYLGDRALGTPDPGARAVVVWLTAIRDTFGSSNRADPSNPA